MGWTLGIDTSHHVAVGLTDGSEVQIREIVTDTRAHVEALIPTVVGCCAQAGISLDEVDEFVVGMGPGPFTGLRVGIATAWTLAHLRSATPRGVCSLDVVARQWALAGAPEQFIIGADARRKELYWRTYDASGRALTSPQVSAPSKLPDLPIAGAIPSDYADSLNVDPAGPTALDPVVLATDWELFEEAGPEPYYLRAADATVPGRPKSALPRLRARR